MSYLDQRMSPARIWAIVIVAVLHVLIGFAFVTGFYQKFTGSEKQDLDVFDVEEPPPPEEEPEADEPQTLLQILSEHLSLAFLARGRADTSDREAREWDRLLVGYLTLLSQWLWEDPQAVRQFLEAGALGIVSRLSHTVVTSGREVADIVRSLSSPSTKCQRRTRSSPRSRSSCSGPATSLTGSQGK